NGYNTTACKVFETQDAIKDGADEIDMVINIGELKAGNPDFVKNEVAEIKKACGNKILKVIIETCLLTDDEKKAMCKIVTETGAEYIKTSTGFSTAGATREDISLFAANIGKDVKMKAAGGIANIQDAEDFLALGCERLGTSRIVKLAKNG
ncbi:MAG: deoxyribose-phosphate aldolase, partial [Spirochaetaceae bacterium]|nr:deoxyribose-phosphate aldolase [Spirochaetaceae bacterium]